MQCWEPNGYKHLDPLFGTSRNQTNFQTNQGDITLQGIGIIEAQLVKEKAFQKAPRQNNGRELSPNNAC